jgi:hypothetical protein
MTYSALGVRARFELSLRQSLSYEGILSLRCWHLDLREHNSLLSGPERSHSSGDVQPRVEPLDGFRVNSNLYLSSTDRI